LLGPTFIDHGIEIGAHRQFLTVVGLSLPLIDVVVLGINQRTVSVEDLQFNDIEAA
jgi:hypothetical protein